MTNFILLDDEDLKKLLAGEQVQVGMSSEWASALCGSIPVYIQKKDAFKNWLKNEED